MDNKKLTEENEFGELKKLLHDLPKVKAPDNFEFNLMTRIENENFQMNSGKKKKGFFSWALTPAIAFAVTVFFILFTFTGNEDLDDNPWQTPPKLIEQTTNVSAGKTLVATDVSKKGKESNKIVRIKSVNNGSYATASVPKQLPFDKSSSVDLDDYLGNNSATSNNGAAQLASSTSRLVVSPFDGFFLREVVKAREQDSLKNKTDSTSN